MINRRNASRLREDAISRMYSEKLSNIVLFSVIFAIFASPSELSARSMDASSPGDLPRITISLPETSEVVAVNKVGTTIHLSQQSRTVISLGMNRDMFKLVKREPYFVMDALANSFQRAFLFSHLQGGQFNFKRSAYIGSFPARIYHADAYNEKIKVESELILIDIHESEIGIIQITGQENDADYKALAVHILDAKIIE